MTYYRTDDKPGAPLLTPNWNIFYYTKYITFYIHYSFGRSNFKSGCGWNVKYNSFAGRREPLNLFIPFYFSLRASYFYELRLSFLPEVI